MGIVEDFAGVEEFGVGMEDFAGVEKFGVGSRDGMNHCPGLESVYLVSPAIYLSI